MGTEYLCSSWGTIYKGYKLSNELEVIEIDNVGDYIKSIREFEHRHIAQWFFRGHPDSSFKLVPSLYRLSLDGSFATWNDLEKYMMDAFQRESVPFLNHMPADYLEWLAVAQHYGLPTRLLDWTSNPLIGLYFAVESSFQSDANVWCIGIPSTNNCLPESTNFAQRITLAKAGFLYFPRHAFDRTINQSGCFTVHESEIPLEEANQFPLNIFIRVRIAAANKAPIINELFTLGIHRGFVYPGLEGIAKRLHFEVSMRHTRNTTELLSKTNIDSLTMTHQSVPEKQLDNEVPSRPGVGSRAESDSH